MDAEDEEEDLGGQTFSYMGMLVIFQPLIEFEDVCEFLTYSTNLPVPIIHQKLANLRVA